MFLLDLADQLVPLQHTAITGDIISSKIITTAGDSTGVVLVGSTGKVSSFRIDHPEDGACSARLTAQSSTTTAKLLVADVSEDGTVTTVGKSEPTHTTIPQAYRQTLLSSYPLEISARHPNPPRTPISHTLLPPQLWYPFHPPSHSSFTPLQNLPQPSFSVS